MVVNSIYSFISGTIKRTNCGVFCCLLLVLGGTTAVQAKNLFFIHSDSLFAFDHYTTTKVVQGKKTTVRYSVSTSIIDFDAEYGQLSPFLKKTETYAQLFKAKVLRYSLFENFTLDGIDYLEQSTGYCYLDSSRIELIRQVTLRSDNLSNEFYDLNKNDSIPQLYVKNYLNRDTTHSLLYKELFTEEALFWIVRYMAELKLSSKKLYLLDPLVHGLFSEKVYFTTIEFEDEYYRLQGIRTQKVVVTREDGKKAEFWVSLEASKRIVKAHDFRGRWFDLKKSFVRPLQKWPF